MIRIPLRTDLTFYELQIPLSAVTYTLQFRWILREGAWYMDVLDEPGNTMLIAGVKIVVNYFLCVTRTGREPAGLFLALDTTGGAVDPGIDELGGRVKLYYFTPEELAASRAELAA